MQLIFISAKNLYKFDCLDYDFDTSVTYVGVMSPEENMIVIIQNILLFISSSIGYLLLVPFYQVNFAHTRFVI